MLSKVKPTNLVINLCMMLLMNVWIEPEHVLHMDLILNVKQFCAVTHGTKVKILKAPRGILYMYLIIICVVLHAGNKRKRIIMK